ncbi:oral cancer overexpressed protein 1 [Striga asiatica]|uniref:Oral cancer overexpressed protein 1 n=1 Tax=Striga asiatica TaxID=4170 RepID=A0A5A7Q785_STRAF|nr:oral cancer overexpressed protein 1 [Striga asiatica]
MDGGIEDIFASSLNLEETHLKEGYGEGHADGLIAGKEEGRQVGLKTGFEVGEELGFYRGCLDIWSSAVRVDPDFVSDRIQRMIKQMDQLLEKYPILEPENERVSDMMDSLRLKFRAICASMNVKLEYDGYPKASHAAAIARKKKPDLDPSPLSPSDDCDCPASPSYSSPAALERADGGRVVVILHLLPVAIRRFSVAEVGVKSEGTFHRILKPTTIKDARRWTFE